MAWKWELGGAARWRIARVERMHVRIGRPAPGATCICMSHFRHALHTCVLLGGQAPVQAEVQVSALPNLIIIDIALMAEACSGEEPLVYVIDWQILAAPHPNVSKKKKNVHF